jgi:hypothetical protein
MDRRSGEMISGRKLAHDAIERRLALEADTGPAAQRQVAAVELGVIGKAAERTEHAGIGFGPAQPEAARDGERHLVAAMGKQRAARPAMAFEHVDRAGVLHDAVGVRRVDLDDVVAIRAQAAEADEIFHVLRREQVLAGRERGVVAAGDLREQRKIERIARLLEPAQLERRQRPRIGERLVAQEFRIGVDGELRAGGEKFS